MTVEAGLSVSFQKTVGAPHTAVAHRSGDVPMLATPQAIAWCEEATVMVLADKLPEESTTVGMRVKVDHVRPVTVGSIVSVTATLSRIEGRRLTFEVAVCEGDHDVALGQVVRVVVHRDRFIERARES